ncbi:Mov34/MPN/PAD-1 family protein, partial [Acinetobacter baumannii]
FRLERANEISASPSHLEYRPPVLDDCEHIVVDIHSHGAARAFWSSTDNADDQHHTRLCAVYGSLSRDVATFTSAARICANKIIFDI